VPPPLTTALGGLLTHLKRNADDYQPSNITFSHIAPWEGTRLKKREKYEAMAERALRDLAAWSTARSAQVA
jgi:methylenetetrahydrofolate--tRNA-(uracil-5-)-methyltransferase